MASNKMNMELKITGKHMKEFSYLAARNRFWMIVRVLSSVLNTILILFAIYLIVRK